MKETIVGALIIGGLIGGAILLTNPKTHNSYQQINPAMDMVWMSDDVHMNDQDGNKHIVIKKMRKPHGEHVFAEKSNGNFIIKMDSENLEDIDIDLDKILNEITEEVSDEHDGLNINISVKSILKVQLKA